jgi:hypothetical protein
VTTLFGTQMTFFFEPIYGTPMNLAFCNTQNLHPFEMIEIDLYMHFCEHANLANTNFYKTKINLKA